MEDDEQKTSMERVVLPADFSGASAASAQAESPSVDYRLRLKDGHNESVRALERSGGGHHC